MITKFNYKFQNGKTVREADYSFTTIEELNERLSSIFNVDMAKSIVNATLKGEKERTIIELEDMWFSIQHEIQAMDSERVNLQKTLEKGDSNGNPLTIEQQESIKAKITDLSEGTKVIKRETYDHMTRKTHVVEEKIQTRYTKVVERRNELENVYPFLKGYRGLQAPSRPETLLISEKETKIRKELVRQQIKNIVGDSNDLIADISKKVEILEGIVFRNIMAQTNEEDKSVATVYLNSGYKVSNPVATYEKLLNRSKSIASILATDYIK